MQSGGGKAKVSGVVFADSDEDEGATAAAGGEGSPEMRESLAGSSVRSSSDLISSFVEVGNGSCFWALLADDVSSDDELSVKSPPTSEVVVSSNGSASAELCCPLAQEVQAEQAAGGGGPIRPSRPEVLRIKSSVRARRVPNTDPKLMRRQDMAYKPWKGPLPLAAYTRTWSLGYLRVWDRRVGRKGVMTTLGNLAEEEVPPAACLRLPALGKKGSLQQDLDPFRSPRRDPIVAQVLFRFAG
jgi:hypothetical protein